ncbi:TlpA family protein disulfide reductase [Humisphaera borealis]|uniref:Redoxin domain-containing protein n=1 Tax=Humisphaera borealis TaxID=2807512 RepID=A0A7M2WQI9_9BACT|nr:redoxin domain-containing protein [Humisphaera borealis]QOV87673.1 redoxin domain-containing protein [Humisphaera borealis]
MAHAPTRWHRRFCAVRTSVAVALLATGVVAAAPADQKPADQKPGDQKPARDDTARVKVTKADGPELLKPKTPATKPATQPAKAKLDVSKDARELLDAVRAAYKGVESLKLAGTISADIDMNGEKNKNSSEFEASFQSPLKFRHQTREHLTGGKAESQFFGGTGKKLYAFESRYNYFYLADAPKDRVKSGELPKQLVGLMSQLNPSLLLAIVPDAAEELMDGVDKLAKVDDVKIDDVAYPALKLSFGKESELTIAFDSKSHLIRRTVWDRKGYAIEKKQQDVKKVEVTIDYALSQANASVKDVDFNWTPPVGARDVTALAEAGGGAADDGPEDGAASALVGKPAPDFKLKDLEGKEVKLSDLKGQVVMLDFWATWCGPCRASMPHLDAIYKEFGDKGLKAFAVNLREKDTVIKPFVEKTKLGMPVLLDVEGKVAKSFGVSGIPQTVVIDKDGKIVKVTVGSGTHEQIKTAIEEALK